MCNKHSRRPCSCMEINLTAKYDTAVEFLAHNICPPMEGNCPHARNINSIPSECIPCWDRFIAEEIKNR